MKPSVTTPGLKTLLSVAAFFLFFAHPLAAQEIRRREALKIAESYVQHRWRATPRNILHGKDGRGIDVNTPDRAGGRGTPRESCWLPDVENIGVAYKWGGIDTPESFDKGVSAGKAAGDVYTAEKRQGDDAAVSDSAVGVDCSGFICRCWKTRERYSTSTFHTVCRKLSSPADLQPADIMNHARGHVIMFVKWLDPEKKRALFYESAPFSKTLASKRNVAELTTAGYVPMRYRDIRE